MSDPTTITLKAALADCLESLKRLPDVDGAFRQTCIWQAEQALRTADPSALAQLQQDVRKHTDHARQQGTPATDIWLNQELWDMLRNNLPPNPKEDDGPTMFMGLRLHRRSSPVSAPGFLLGRMQTLDPGSVFDFPDVHALDLDLPSKADFADPSGQILVFDALRQVWVLKHWSLFAGKTDEEERKHLLLRYPRWRSYKDSYASAVRVG